MASHFASSSEAPRPIAVDLFAGAGGLSLGLEQAGFEVAAAVEINRRAADTHERNFPNTSVLRRDVRWLRAKEIRSAIIKNFATTGRTWSGEVALTAGGPPCQGYSFGGHRNVDDGRNALVHEFRRLVTTLESRYFIMENVPGLLAGKHRRILDDVVRSFNRAGYELAEPVQIDASKLGLPQSRRRVLLVGWKKGEVAVDVAAIQKIERARTTVAEAIGDLPEIENFEFLLEQDTCSSTRRKGASRSKYALLMRKRALGLAHPRAWNGRPLTGCSRTVHSEEVIERFLSTKPDETEPISRYRRLAAKGLAPTLRAGTGPDHGSHTPPRPIHYRTPRVISVREAARLQSFPDWFRFSVSKWHAWQEIGNAVPPVLARELGSSVVTAMRLNPK